MEEPEGRNRLNLLERIWNVRKLGGAPHTSAFSLLACQ
jgi:hypothetical protein